MLKKIFCFLVFTSVFYSCSMNNSESKLGEGNVRFSFSSPSINSRSLDFNSEDAKGILITLEDSTGEVIFNQKELKIYNAGGSFLTEPVTLRVGDYNITEYSVLDKDNSVIFASPQEGATLAYLVSDPLPVSFSISLNSVTQINPEVVDTSSKTIEDFGYTSSQLNIVENFDVLVKSVALEQSGFVDTESEIEISYMGESLYSGLLTSGVNLVTFKKGSNILAPYTITVTKSGYKTFEESYSENELKDFENNPLNAILKSPYSNVEYLSYSQEQMYDLMGDATDITPDGKFVVVSSKQKSRIHIYKNENNSWLETTITPSDNSTGDYGESVAINSTGDVIVVSASMEGDNGAVYIYRFDGSNWNEHKIEPGTSAIHFGGSVGIDGSGSRIAVGSRINGPHDGQVYIFDYDGVNYTETIVSRTDSVNSDWFGETLDISEDGKYLVVGAPMQDGPGGEGCAGAGYLFNFDGSNWNQVKKFIPSDIVGNLWVGISVAVSDDGSKVAFGSCDGHVLGSSKPGKVYVYKNDGLNWNETIISNNDIEDDDRYSASIDLSGDGSVLAVGASQETFDSGMQWGSVYIYKENDQGTYSERKLTQKSGELRGALGYSVALNFDGSIVAGTAKERRIGQNRGLGACLIFR